MEVRRFHFECLSIVLVAAGACLADFQVNTYTNGDQYSPFVAMNDRGDSVVVWRSTSLDGRGGGVFGRLFDPNGRPKGNEFQVNVTRIEGHVGWRPVVAVRDSGEFVVTWTTADDGHSGGIAARRFADNGVPLADEVIVNTYTHLAQSSPSIAMNEHGDGVVVWESWHGTDDHNAKSYVAGRLFDCNDMPKGSEFIISQSTNGGSPMVAMDESGDFVVAWVRDGSPRDLPLGRYIKFRRYNANGTPKGDEVRITEDLVARVEPSIGMDSVGNFTITRSSYEGDWDHTDVYAHRFGAEGNEITPPFLVNSCTDGGQLLPSIAMRQDGRFVIVWLSHRREGGGKDIFGRRYDSTGAPLGDEFQINDNTLSEDTYPYPIVAVRADGAFVVVWESAGQDGSGDGIFMQPSFPWQPQTVTVPNQFADIQTAIHAAVDGDTIVVRPGIYRENITLSGKNVTLTSLDSNINHSTIIDGDRRGSVITLVSTEGPGCLISGFTIQGGVAAYGGGINANGTCPIIRNCLIQGNTATEAGGGISACHGRMENCVITDNSARTGAGLYDCGAHIVNCTIAHNAARDSGGGLYDCNGHVANCILWDNQPDQLFNSSLPIFSCIEGMTDGQHNISDVPGFALPGDYHLMNSSACIDRGSDTEIDGFITTDIDGNPRQLDGNGDGDTTVDMGAFEYNPNAPSIAVSTRQVHFVSTHSRTDPDSQVLLIRNGGAGTLNWEILEDCPWLQVEPISGHSLDDINHVALNVDGASLAYGQHYCDLIISAQGAANSPLSIRIRLDVKVEQGYLHVPEEYATIQEAIDDAYDGETVVVADGVYTGQGNKNIDFRGKQITVRSMNGPEVTVIDCENDGRGFRFHNGEGPNACLGGFGVCNGSAGGILCYPGSPRIENCILSNNTGGAGITLRNGSHAILTGCRIYGNRGDYGGGIYCWASNPKISSCRIYANSASAEGGGIRIYNNASPEIANCIISGNTALGVGGGIQVRYRNCRPVITNCTIADNTAASGGGGVNCGDDCLVTIVNSICWGNSADGVRVEVDENFFVNGQAEIAYSDIQGGWSGNGNNNIAVNPLFVDASSPDVNERDYHLQSRAGRWSPVSGTWVTDNATSPCIDAGDPNSPIGNEAVPNGGIINMGAYGGTEEASLSPEG